MTERPETSSGNIHPYLDFLSSTISNGSDHSSEALSELSNIALGGNDEARKLVEEIDQKVSAGEITLPHPDTKNVRNHLFKDVLYIACHPILALSAKLRQIAVSIEHEAPPYTSTWEDFPNLTLPEAIKTIKDAQGDLLGGVPKNAWSKVDQERMERGELPQGHPEHPNI